MLPFIFNALIFLASCLLLTFSSKWLVNSLCRIAFFLRLKEFVVGFFLMAFAASAPNLFVGLISAFNNIPELSLGDVVGGNIVDLSLVIGLAALVSNGGLSAQSRTVQGSSIFTIFIALMPLFLIFNGTLSRVDGLLLILSFAFYIFWLFSKKERFTKVYEHCEEKIKLKTLLMDLGIVIAGFAMLIAGAKGVVTTATFFSETFGLSLGLIGIFLIGVGNSLPETFFSLQAARKAQDWMVLGDIMGGVAITATLVLGTVALIAPITIDNFSPFAIARLFMVISALFFLFCVRSGEKITRKEGLFLVGVYIAFLITEIIFK